MRRYMTFSAVLTAATIATATPAAADPHEIYITASGAFFPQTTYLQIGDTLRFINISGDTQHVHGRNNNWKVEYIYDDHSKTVKINSANAMDFRGTTQSNKKYQNLGNSDKYPRGYLNKNNPPLG